MIPAVLMVEEGDQKWVVSIEWDFKFIPKNKATLQEYNRLIIEFDKKHKVSKNFSNSNHSTPANSGVKSVQVSGSESVFNRYEIDNDTWGFQPKSVALPKHLTPEGSPLSSEAQEVESTHLRSHGLIVNIGGVNNQNIETKGANFTTDLHGREDEVPTYHRKVGALIVNDQWSFYEVGGGCNSSRLEIIDHVLAVESCRIQAVAGREVKFPTNFVYHLRQ